HWMLNSLPAVALRRRVERWTFLLLTSDFRPLSSDSLRREKYLPRIWVLHLDTARKAADIDIARLRRIRTRDKPRPVRHRNRVGQIAAFAALVPRHGRRSGRNRRRTRRRRRGRSRWWLRRVGLVFVLLRAGACCLTLL